jgi:hypothetical protein
MSNKMAFGISVTLENQFSCKTLTGCNREIPQAFAAFATFSTFKKLPA